MTNIINYIHNELGYRVLKTSYFGSHQFNLDNKDSDIDLIVVVERNKDYYHQLFEPDLSIPFRKIDGMDVQFLDVKKYLQLLAKSNFTAISLTYNNIFIRPGYEYLFNINLEDINVNKVAHHLLGLINSKQQKVYMRAYFVVLLDYILTHKAMPNTLNYKVLLNNTNSPIAADILESKKNNISPVYDDIWCKITHDEINSTLPSSNNLYNVAIEKWNNYEYAF